MLIKIRNYKKAAENSYLLLTHGDTNVFTGLYHYIYIII